MSVDHSQDGSMPVDYKHYAIETITKRTKPFQIRISPIPSEKDCMLTITGKNDKLIIMERRKIKEGIITLPQSWVRKLKVGSYNLQITVNSAPWVWPMKMEIRE